MMTGLPERAEPGAAIGELTMTLALLVARRRPMLRIVGDAFRMTGDDGADLPVVLLVGVDRDGVRVILDDGWLSSMGILCCGLG